MDALDAIMLDQRLVIEAAAPMVENAPTVPVPFTEQPPEITGSTIMEYAVDVNERPALALVRAFGYAMRASAHHDEVMKYLAGAVEHFKGVDAQAQAARDQMQDYLFGPLGAVAQLKSIFATERQLNREAATGGLLDAAERIEEIVTQFTAAKQSEFDAHAQKVTAELDRDLHRITLASLQGTLTTVVAEKASLAADRARLDVAIQAANERGRLKFVMPAAIGFAGGIGLMLVLHLVK